MRYSIVLDRLYTVERKKTRQSPKKNDNVSVSVKSRGSVMGIPTYPEARKKPNTKGKIQSIK